MLKSLPALALLLTLAACGGSSPSNSVVTNKLAGTAATGAPIVNAGVYVKDKDGNEPTGQDAANGIAVVTTDAQGAFAFTSTQLANLMPPLLVEVRGTSVLDNGDSVAAVFHAVSDGQQATTNITHLTEAVATLALGSDPKASFESPNGALDKYTAATAAAANDKLVAALGIGAATAFQSFNATTSPIDTTASAETDGVSNARMHDLLLDSLTMSSSQGRLILTDRNQPEASFVGGPSITVTPGETLLETSGGAISGVKAGLSPTRLQAWLDRLNAQLANGCTNTDNILACDGVLDSASKVFSSDFKNNGMSAGAHLKGWIFNALGVDSMSDVTVSLVTPARGTFTLANGTEVTRVLLKWQSPTIDDHVFRSLLLTDDGSNVFAYGNQKDYFIWLRPRLEYAPDSDGTYPYGPTYEAFLNVVAKTWYGGIKDAVVGALINGPGLPQARLSQGNNAFGGDPVNPNDVSSGIEIFDLRAANGCSNMSIEPSVYVEKNTSSDTRYKSGSTTCRTGFSFHRYQSELDSGFKLPKRGDEYTVTLYLKDSAFTDAGKAFPDGATADTITVGIGGDPVAIHKFDVKVKLGADMFSLDTSKYAANMFPGISDASREGLVSFTRGGNKTIAWTRNRVKWVDTDAQGNEVVTPFVNFVAGGFQSSYDALRSKDTYKGGADPEITNGTNFRSLGSASYDSCGQTVAAFRGGDINVFASHKTSGSMPNCSQIASASQDDYWYLLARYRARYAKDSYSLISANTKSFTQTWDSMAAREAVGSANLCSSIDGFWQFRSVYVQLVDINGRAIQERREVWSDFPDLTAYTGASRDWVTRPNKNSDNVYIPFKVDASEYLITDYDGEKGVIQPAYTRAENGSCEKKVW